MAINIKIERNSGENNLSILRRFRRRMKSSGIVPRIRKGRYYERPKSKLLQKEYRLKHIERAKEQERLYKLGKIDRA